MDREYAKKLVANIELIKAFAEGKVVQGHQFDSQNNEVWVDLNNPSFQSAPTSYRLKPEPQSRWIIRHKGDPTRVWSTWLSKEAAQVEFVRLFGRDPSVGFIPDGISPMNWEIVEYREVVES